MELSFRQETIIHPELVELGIAAQSYRDHHRSMGPELTPVRSILATNIVNGKISEDPEVKAATLEALQEMLLVPYREDAEAFKRLSKQTSEQLH